MAPVETAGFGLRLVPEDEGAFGGDWGDANAVLRIAGVMVPELPVAELIAGEALQPAATVSLMAGAMGRALALSIDHVNTRQHFGRPEERSVGQEWVSTCRSRWSPGH